MKNTSSPNAKRFLQKVSGHIALALPALLSAKMALASQAQSFTAQYDLTGNTFSETMNITFLSNVTLDQVVTAATDPNSVMSLDPKVVKMEVSGDQTPGQTFEVFTSAKKLKLTATVVEECTDTRNTSNGAQSFSRSCTVRPDLKQGKLVIVSGHHTVTCTRHAADPVSCAMKFEGTTKDLNLLFTKITGRHLAVSGLQETIVFYGGIFSGLNQSKTYDDARNAFLNSPLSDLSDNLDNDMENEIVNVDFNKTIHVDVNPAQAPGYKISVK